MMTVKVETMSDHRCEFSQPEISIMVQAVWDAHVNAKNPIAKQALSEAHTILCALAYGKVIQFDHEMERAKRLSECPC